MAMTSKWDDAVRRFESLRVHASLESAIDSMLRLIAVLLKDSRFFDVIPNVSHLALTLHLPAIQRYLAVEHSTADSGAFVVSFVDPPLELSEPRVVSEAEVIPALVLYLEQLRQLRT